MNETSLPVALLALDPGTRKVGYAVVAQDGELLAHGIAPIADLGSVLAELRERFELPTVLVGGGTGIGAVERDARAALPHAKLHVVPEEGSTLLARGVYFAHNPPRGWQRLIPRGMRVPREPYDDFVALILAQRFLAATHRNS